MAAKAGFKIAEEIRWCGEGLCSWHHPSGPESSSWAVFASSLQPCFLNRRGKQQPGASSHSRCCLSSIPLIWPHTLSTALEPSDKHPCVLNRLSVGTLGKAESVGSAPPGRREPRDEHARRVFSAKHLELLASAGPALGCEVKRGGGERAPR